jgi:MFS family permease
MPKRQFVLFSLAMILIVGGGNGMANLMPVYLGRMGADSTYIGLLFALLYLGLASAGILAGWLSDRFQQRKWLCVASGAGGILAAIGLLVVHSLTFFSIILFFAWFMAGVHTALISVLVGLQAGKEERGRVFGLLGFMMGVGPILSGFLYGPIVDRAGFPTLFAVSVALPVAWTALALFYKEPVLALPEEQRVEARPQPAGMKATFFLLALAYLFGWVSINGGRLGITLVMDRLEFSASDISATAGVAGLVALPMPILIGWLSDRIGRKGLMIALNLLGVAALLILSQASTLAGFSLAAALLSLYSNFTTLGNALTADLVPPQAMGFWLSLMTSTSNIAGIFSSPLVGWTIASLGAANTFLAALVLPLGAVLLLARVQEIRPVFVMNEEKTK